MSSSSYTEMKTIMCHGGIKRCSGSEYPSDYYHKVSTLNIDTGPVFFLINPESDFVLTKNTIIEIKTGLTINADNEKFMYDITPFHGLGVPRLYEINPDREVVFEIHDTRQTNSLNDVLSIRQYEIIATLRLVPKYNLMNEVL